MHPGRTVKRQKHRDPGCCPHHVVQRHLKPRRSPRSSGDLNPWRPGGSALLCPPPSSPPLCLAPPVLLPPWSTEILQTWLCVEGRAVGRRQGRRPEPQTTASRPPVQGTYGLWEGSSLAALPSTPARHLVGGTQQPVPSEPVRTSVNVAPASHRPREGASLSQGRSERESWATAATQGAAPLCFTGADGQALPGSLCEQ